MYLLQWQIDEYTTNKTRIEAELVKLDLVIAQYLENPNGSYMINTGQTTQQVSKINIQSYLDMRDRLRSERYQILVALNGTVGRTANFFPDF